MNPSAQYTASPSGPRLLAALAAAFVLAQNTLMASPLWKSEGVLFSRDVIGVLTKSGCNEGGCHGARDGKGGLKLSLFGESRGLDYTELTESGTRLNLADPDRSWLSTQVSIATG